MNNIAGYTASGRRLKGPASDIVELTGENGEMLSAVVFHPEYRAHRGINGSLDVVARFLEDPMVPDLVEMVARDAEQGAFVYDTGPVWAVADIIRILADLGDTAGARAGVELMLRAGHILCEAASFGASENVYSHGGLTPWRLVLRQDGRVMVIGHALPQVEILMFHEDHTVLPPSDSFRYCPPERIHGQEEDLSSDLFSLSLIAFEFMTGKPVYDGLVNDIRQQAAGGAAAAVLFRARESLPAAVRDILGNAMRLEMHDRFAEGEVFLEAVEAALHSGDVRGPSLADVMRKVSSQMQRRGVVPDAASTVMGTPAEILAMLGDDDDAEPVTAPKREKWQPPGRASKATRRPEGEPTPTPTPEANETPASPDASDEKRWSSTVRRSGTRRPIRRKPAEDSGESLEASAPLTEGAPDADPKRSARASGVRRSVRRGARKPPEAETPAEDAPVDVAKVLRSSRIRKPRRSRTAKPAVEASEAIPSPAESPGLGESLGSPDTPAAVTSTADLLAQIRQSATRSRRSSVDRPSAAKQKIEALVQSADRPGKVDGDGAEEGAADSPPPKAKRARKPRRVRRKASASADGAGEPSPESVDDAAAALALGPPQSEAPEATDPTPEPSVPEAAADPGGASQPEATAPKSAKAAAVPSPPSTSLHAGDFRRPPAPLPAGARSSGAAAFVFRRGPGGKGSRMRLPNNATTAEAISWLVGNMLPVRTDLTGRLTSWYRLSNASGLLPPDTLLSSLDPDQPLIIETVLNETRLVDLRVVGEPDHRFVAPMGTAVPVGTLVDHITTWLGLPEGSYSLHGPSGPLPPHVILADLAATAERLALVLRQSDKGESA